MFTDRKDIKSGDCYCSFDEEQMVSEIPGCDYVVAQNRSEFLDDVDWLSEAYNIPIKIEEVKDCDEREITVGVVDADGIEKLKEGLLKEKHERIEKLKECLKKDENEVSMWEISYDAYKNSCFYFVSAGMSFDNEMDLLENYLMQESPREIIITESYDYHV
jgi:hypothetical protein